MPDLKGGDAAALVGGIALLTMFGARVRPTSRPHFLETSAEHVVDGLVFAFKAMGVVLPIAGFFFIGNGDFSGPILEHSRGTARPGLPVRPRRRGAGRTCRTNGFVTAFGILIIGMIAGLEGSGFSGLPLTGSLAGSLAHGAGVSSRDAGRDRSDGQHLVRWRHARRLVLPDRRRRLRPGAGGRAGPASASCPSSPVWWRARSSRWSSSASARPTAAPDRSCGPGLLRVRGVSAALHRVMRTRGHQLR